MHENSKQFNVYNLVVPQVYEATSRILTRYSALGVTELNKIEIMAQRSQREKELFYSIEDIRDESDRFIQKWNELKDLPYSQDHKNLFSNMEFFVDQHNC